MRSFSRRRALRTLATTPALILARKSDAEDEAALKVELPAEKPSDYAIVLKIVGA